MQSALPSSALPAPQAAAPRRSPSHAGNSYDFVRFCAAAAVLFSHHFDLAGRAEPQVPLFGEDFGVVAVEVFFCLSGFLLCRSLRQGRGLADFVRARLLRIAPNLAVALVATSLVTLLWYRNGSHLADHVRYVGHNLLMMVAGVRQTIPGVFTDTVRPSLNEPLWTLPYELWLYVVIAALVLAGGRRNAILVATAALAAGIAFAAIPLMDEIVIGPLESEELFKLAAYFLAGAALAPVWPTVTRHAVAIGAAGLAVTLALRNLVPIDTPLHPLALALAVIGLGQARTMAWFARGGDASYGIYIFAWPVQQFAQVLIGSFWLSLVVAFAVSTAIGYATWHGFEKRALRLARRPAPPTALQPALAAPAAAHS